MAVAFERAVFKLNPISSNVSKLCTKRSRVLVRAALAERTALLKRGSWTWKHENKPVKINYIEHSKEKKQGDILFLPTVSDVSTTEEWESVAEQIVSRDDKSWRTLTVDWPGFGLSDRPSLNYTADAMEDFLVEFTSSQSGPFANTSTAPVVVGGGHAATIALKAIAKGRMGARGFVAVAPTWSGPLPIVFGKTPEAESRYGLLRTALRAPGVGWALYNVLVSSPSNIRKQYESHVYADSSNVTESVVESRLALTRREGARYGPAAFLTGMLDPVGNREEFLELFSQVDGKLPVMVMFSEKSPRRSRAEMAALRGAKGVGKFVEIPGALLPQEEFPDVVAAELYGFLESL